DLQGKKVMEATGKKIGEVNSMLVDSQSGQVKYIMLTSGGVFGVGGEDYLIPWQALQTAPDQQGFQVDLTSEELKEAPKGAEVTSRDQAQEIHEFFGVSPEREESEQMGGEAGTKMDKESQEKHKKGEDKEEAY
ncbi:MAG: PRC-barrel domain-containing protein, partial [Thermodesulfobacteriota bacterium]